MHLGLVADDLAEAACEQDDVKQRLECVGEQVRHREGKLLHILRDALVCVRQACTQK